MNMSMMDAIVLAKWLLINGFGIPEILVDKEIERLYSEAIKTTVPNTEYILDGITNLVNRLKSGEDQNVIINELSGRII